MKYSPGTSLISHTSRCSGVSVSTKSKGFVCLNLLLKLWRVYLLVTVPNLTLIFFDISSKIIIESCSVKFEENDGSQVGQVDVCAGDEIPQDAIVRMGVGFFRPIEGHLVAD